MLHYVLNMAYDKYRFLTLTRPHTYKKIEKAKSPNQTAQTNEPTAFIPIGYIQKKINRRTWKKHPMLVHQRLISTT